MPSTLVRSVLLGAAGAGLAQLCAPAWAASTYVALGDSITFGETDLRYVPSAGDRGYVALFANQLAAANGGVRPGVVNLAIDGETSSSFFSGYGRTPPVQGRGDAPLQAENVNYTSPAQTQAQLFDATVRREQAAGNSVDTVTVTLGFNELAALASLPPQTGLDAIASTLARYRVTYAAVLGDIRSLLPDADLYLVNYYNPFPADPGSPAAPIFNAGGDALNATIQGLAAQFGARYVDEASSFVGHEAEYTYLDDQPHGATVPDPYGGVLPIGNVHPNAAGYAAIAAQLVPGAVPEPAPWTMMIGGFGLVGAALRRRRAAPPGPARDLGQR